MQKDLDLNKISCNSITKIYFPEGDTPFRNISFNISKGDFVCLIGPSGCGKSSLLKILAGLEEATIGTVKRPQKVSLVFQSGALLPWLSVRENIIFGLKNQNESKETLDKIVEKYSRILGLRGLEEKYPHEISGGQRQRVGIARALAVSPEVLFLDEPFSALDEKIKAGLYIDLIKIWKEMNLTIVMVSHDIEEAVTLAQKVFLLRDTKLANIFSIPLPYPRDLQGDKFQSLVRKIREKFMKE